MLGLSQRKINLSIMLYSLDDTVTLVVLQEDEGTKEAKNHQLLTEDIDSILARAEVSIPSPHLLQIQQCNTC